MPVPLMAMPFWRPVVLLNDVMMAAPLAKLPVGVTPAPLLLTKVPILKLVSAARPPVGAVFTTMAVELVMLTM